MLIENITTEDVRDALEKTQNWKSPKSDCIPNFWLKNMKATHKHLAKNYNQRISNERFPEWSAIDIIYLIPKSGDSKQVKNYRPPV